MNTHSLRIHRDLVLGAALAGLALLVLPRAAEAQASQILEIWDDSITTYLSPNKTSTHQARPLPEQRGVGLDGSWRQPSSLLMALAGNPMERGPGGSAGASMAGIWLNTGTPVIHEIDIALPAPGFSWVIGRSYNPRQKDSGGSYYDSAGPQGRNWFQLSQPEIVYDQGGTDDKDAVYLVYGADRYIEFKRYSTTSNQYKAKNGGAGVMDYAAGAGSEPDTFTYTDQVGNRIFFFGFDADAGAATGQIWKVIDPAGNVAYVGDATTASTAISNGYNGSGFMTTAYDTADRRFTYTYTSSRISEIKAETKTGGTWSSPTGVATVGKVAYTYYGNETYGDTGALKVVKVTVPQTDATSSTDVVKSRYFRYWEGTFNASTNPGHPYGLQYIYDFEGIRNYDYSDAAFDDDHLTASESTLKPYAGAYFEYDSEHRVVETWSNGACGCSGAADGVHTLEYEANTSFSGTSGYDTTWKQRTVVKLPPKTDVSPSTYAWHTQYFDEVGQPLHRVISDADPDSASNFWITKVTRDSIGCTTHVHTPANATAYTHAIGGSWGITSSSSAGLVHLMQRISSGDTTGFVEHIKFREGYSATNSSYTLQSSVFYEPTSKSVTDVTVVRALPEVRWTYTSATTTEASASSGPAGANMTSMAYTFYTGDAILMPKKIITTHPAVTTGNNGSNSSNTSTQYLRKDGTTAFTEGPLPDSIFTYTKFTWGQLVKSIVDTQTNHSTDFASGDDPNTDFGITESGSGLRHITEHVYDAQGRLDTTTRNVQTSSDKHITKVYYSRLASHQLVTLRYGDYETSPSTKFYGPVSYSVTNHAGRSTAQALVKLTSNESTSALTLHIDETDADLITAMDLGTVARLDTSVYDEAGTQLDESRNYISIPASGAGTEGTNFDATFLAYDNAGRQWRSKDATGTIHRSAVDNIGRPVTQWIGTNDNSTSFPGGESSGTSNMVKTAETTYDSGSAGGNSFVTKRTAYIQDSDTDKRETTFTNNFRGHALLVTSPQAPHVFSKVDNLGRVIASGLFSSTANIVVGTDDPTTETSNRMGLSQTFFDEMGRVWKTQRHKIDDADGSDDDNLQTLTWYDAPGRATKVDGEQLTKTLYDRVSRPTHQFILGSDNDSTTYANMDDVTGDIVLVESQTSYDPNDGNVIMTARIDRFHDDYGTGETTGALDTNADADALLYTATNVKGRIQISASWFDRFDRVTNTVSYGTNGGSNFDRDPLSVPARSDTALRTDYDYNTDGTLQQTTDPEVLITRHEYDDAGRQTKIIANYVNGTPSSATGADDVHTRFVFTDGLQTKMWVDVDGDNVEDADDQVTIYTFGVIKGASAGDSKIASGSVLQKIQYPDSTGGTDVVTFAINAQGQQIYRKDQAGTIIESDYDTGGRQTHERITTLAGGLDNNVLRKSFTYDSLGRAQLITQYDNATVGSGTVVNEVKYTYDDWAPGQVEKLEQDRDSAVAGGGNDYEISHVYAKATSGRNTVRRTSTTLPDGNVITYEFSSTSNLHDDEASRVTSVKDGAVYLAQYRYNGLADVVSTARTEASVQWLLYSSTPGDYADLDRFNRVIQCRWTKDLVTDVDFYDLDIAYDRDSNIVSTDDAVMPGTDVKYTIDDLNRLTDAQEGTLSGGSISSETRQETWTLEQTGNWELHQFDSDGDGTYVDAPDLNDDRTHNVVNELTARDTDDNGTNNYTLTYDAAGNLTDDGEAYEYVYDGFGRLRKVKRTDNQNLVAEYWYNGLNHRITMHNDTDTDNDVDANDKKYHLAYTERWQIAATFRDTDSSAKESFVYHTAGLSGGGGSSKLDDVLIRDKDANTAWTTASDGTLEERRYMLHNWRGDLVVIVTDTGTLVEQVRHSSYGVPFGMHQGDVDADGDIDATDASIIQGWIDTSTLTVRGDLDLDRDVDATDKSICETNAGRNLGRGKLSYSGVRNRAGYGGYQLDAAIDALYHVRHRVLNTTLGRWTRRDPLGYVDGSSLYQYCNSSPTNNIDTDGTYAGYLVAVFHFIVPVIDTLPPACQNQFWVSTQNPVQCQYDIYDLDCANECALAPNLGGFTDCLGGDFPTRCCICSNNIRSVFLNSPAADAILACTVQEETSQTYLPCCMSVSCQECLIKRATLNCLRNALSRCSTSGCADAINDLIRLNTQLLDRCCRNCLNGIPECY